MTTCTIRATDNIDGDAPYYFEIISEYEVVKKVEKLMTMGYQIIQVDTEMIRYVDNAWIHCSCLSYPPNKKKCLGCPSNKSNKINVKEFLDGIK